MKPRVFIDTETTGFDPEVHEVIEFAARKGDETLEFKVRPQHIETAQEEALEVNGYTEEAWVDAVEMSEALPQIVAFLKGTVVVGHNPGFDMGFINKAVKDSEMEDVRLPYHLIDTVALAYEHLEPCGLWSFRLHNVCKFLGITNEGEHTAMVDVERCRQVYLKLNRAGWLKRLWWRFIGPRRMRRES